MWLVALTRIVGAEFGGDVGGRNGAFVEGELVEVAEDVFAGAVLLADTQAVVGVDAALTAGGVEGVPFSVVIQTFLFFSVNPPGGCAFNRCLNMIWGCPVWLVVLLGMFVGQGDLIEDTRFVLPPDVYLVEPVAATFAPDGRCYLLDRDQKKVLIFDAQGRFQKAFGAEGQGPGEMMDPFQIQADDTAVYIWEDRQMISVFDREGVFQRQFHTTSARPRVFAALNPELLLLGYRSREHDGMYMHFALFDGKGNAGEHLLKEKNRAFVKVGEGDNNVTVRAYMPEVEVQPSGQGTWLAGFSQNNSLMEIDKHGKVVATHRFDLPLVEASDRDVEVMENMSFPNPDGGRVSLKDLPNIKLDFSQPKAYYTHFVVGPERVAFVLTPLGSTDAVSTGHSYGTYVVCDRKTGKRVAHGDYRLAEDSRVFYKNNKVLGCVVNKDEEFEISTYHLKGMK